MRIAGSSSWRFEERDAQDLHSALFARDAGGLTLRPSPEIPPPLAAGWLAGTEAASAVLAQADRAKAAAQWLAWWRRLAGTGADQVRPPASDDRTVRAWRRTRAKREAAAFDPPQFASLAAMPELRTLVTATFGDAQRLLAEREQRRLQRGPQPGAFDFYIVRAAAEQAAVAGDVPIGDIDGVVQVLDVDGLWWYLAAPGRALCSVATAADPAAAFGLLRAVFASRLGRPQRG